MGGRRRGLSGFFACVPASKFGFQQFLGHHGKAARQGFCRFPAGLMGMLAYDGANGIDVLVDQHLWQAPGVGIALYQAAQGGRDMGGDGIAKCLGLALDVVGGMKQGVD